MNLKRLLQLCVIVTAFPPLSWLYRALYWLAIWIVVRALRRQPGLVCIYLTRGAARREIYPGISDIDICVVATEEACIPVAQAYARLCQLVPMLERFGSAGLIHYVMTEEHFLHGLQGATQRRCLFDGKQTWRLLTGRDLLKEMQPLDLSLMKSSMLTEIAIWWSIFLEQHDRAQTRWESHWLRIGCWKLISEFYRQRHAIRTNKYILRRYDAVQTLIPLLQGEERNLAERALHQAKWNFLKPDSRILEDTMRLLPRLINQFHQELTQSPIAEPYQNMFPRLDITRNEMHVSPNELEVIEVLSAEAREIYGSSLLSASLLTSANYSVDSLVLVLRVEESALNTPIHWTRLMQAAEAAQTKTLRALHTAVQLTHIALRCQYLEKAHKRQLSLISPFLFADIGETLGKREFVLTGEPAPFCDAPVWNEWQKEFLLGWRLERYWWLESEITAELPCHIALRRWWKQMQLLAIERSFLRGELLYPLTLPAIRRAMEREGFPLPAELRPLDPLFWEALEGQEVSFAPLFDKAMEFYQQSNAETLEIRSRYQGEL